METWVRAGWVLASNGDMGVCWLGAGQQWRHGCVLASNGDMGVCWLGILKTALDNHSMDSWGSKYSQDSTHGACYLHSF